MFNKIPLPIIIALLSLLIFQTDTKAGDDNWWDNLSDKNYEVNQKIEVNETASGQDGASVNVQVKNKINVDGTSETTVTTEKSPNPSASPSPAESGNSSQSSSSNPTPIVEKNSDSGESDSQKKIEDQQTQNIFVKIWIAIANFWKNFLK